MRERAGGRAPGDAAARRRGPRGPRGPRGQASNGGHGGHGGHGGQADADHRTRTEAIAALFAAGAITDLTPFLAPAGPPVDGGTLASRTVPRMRAAEPPALAGLPMVAEPPMVAGPPVPTASEAGSDTGGRTVVRSV